MSWVLSKVIQRPYSIIKEKAMAPHSSTLAWKIPWTEEPGRLQSMGSLRVGHDWATSLSLFTFMHWRRKWQPTPVFLPGESQRQWAPIYGVAQSRTRLKQLSSSSSFPNSVNKPVFCVGHGSNLDVHQQKLWDTYAVEYYSAIKNNLSQS